LHGQIFRILKIFPTLHLGNGVFLSKTAFADDACNQSIAIKLIEYICLWVKNLNIIFYKTIVRVKYYPVAAAFPFINLNPALHD